MGGAPGRASPPSHAIFAGFRVAEDAVSEHIAPFADVARKATLASHESLVAWVFFLQRRDEDRHARVRPHRRRGARAARSHPRRAARSGPGPRPGRGARALRGAAARHGSRAGRRSHRAGRGRLALPHGARGDHLRRRASRAAQRLGRRRPAGGARRRRARRARRALARRLRPALPDRGPALRASSSTICSRAPTRPPRPGAMPSRRKLASRCADGVTIGSWPSGSSSRTWRRSEPSGARRAARIVR